MNNGPNPPNHEPLQPPPAPPASTLPPSSRIMSTPAPNPHPHAVLGVAGTHTVIEAIRKTGSVTRLLLASSGKIFSGYDGAHPITRASAPRPRDWYSATKLFVN